MKTVSYKLDTVFYTSFQPQNEDINQHILQNIDNHRSIIFIVFGFGVFLYFQFTAQNEKIGRMDGINYGNDAIQIPFTYSKTNHIIVELSIDKSETKYPFILDSGASSMLFKNSNSNFDFEQ